MIGFPSFGPSSIKTIDRSSLFRKDDLELLNEGMFGNQDLRTFFPPDENRVLQIEMLIDPEIDDSEAEFNQLSVQIKPGSEEKSVIITPMILDPIEACDYIDYSYSSEVNCQQIEIMCYPEEIFDFINVVQKTENEKEDDNSFIQLNIPSPLIDTYLSYTNKTNDQQHDNMKIEIHHKEYQPENSSPLTKSDFIPMKNEISKGMGSKEAIKKDPNETNKSNQKPNIQNKIPTKKGNIVLLKQDASQNKKKYEKQKTIEETIGVKKSSLFPRTQIGKGIKKLSSEENDAIIQNQSKQYDPSEFKYAFVCDKSFLYDEDFKEVFSKDCRIAFRTLYDWDIELSPNHCVIIYDSISKDNGPLSAQPKKNKDKNIAKSLSNSLSVFTRVTLFKVGKFNIDDELFLSLCNCDRVVVRQVPCKSLSYNIIKHSLLTKESYITSKETLHEYFYTQFPCVPHIVAMDWLSRGNPMINMRVVDKNHPSGHMLSVILDSKSFVQKATNPSVKRIEAMCRPLSKIKTLQKKKQSKLHIDE